MGDVERVGGKNASLGEMISQLSHLDVNVPNGFATTADAYRDFLRESGLTERISQALDGLDINDVTALAKTGAQIRRWIVEAVVGIDTDRATVLCPPEDLETILRYLETLD